MDKSPCNMSTTMADLERLLSCYEMGLVNLDDTDVAAIKSALEYLQDYMDLIEENVMWEV